MNFRILAFDDDAERRQWDDALAAMRPNLRDVYFTSAYNLAWQECGEGRALGAVFNEGETAILYPFLLRDLEKAPHLGPDWTGYHDVISARGFSGPLVLRPAEQEELFKAFRAAFDAWCHENLVVSELIRFHPLLDNQLGWERHMEVAATGTVVWGRLDRGHTATLETMGATARQNVRLALDAGLTSGVERGEAAYGRLAALLAHDAERRGAPPEDALDERFFSVLRRRLGRAQTLLGVRHEGELIAAALFVGGPTFVHLFAAAADAQYPRLRPNNLLLFAALQWAANGGATVLDLGGGHGGDDELLRLKGGFSQLRATCYVGRVIHLFEEYARALRDHDEAGICLDCDFFPGYRGPLPAGSSSA